MRDYVYEGISFAFGLVVVYGGFTLLYTLVTELLRAL